MKTLKRISALLLALLLAASFSITAFADDEPETPQPEAPKEEPAVEGAKTAPATEGAKAEGGLGDGTTTVTNPNSDSGTKGFGGATASDDTLVKNETPKEETVEEKKAPEGAKGGAAVSNTYNDSGVNASTGGDGTKGGDNGGNSGTVITDPVIVTSGNKTINGSVVVTEDGKTIAVTVKPDPGTSASLTVNGSVTLENETSHGAALRPNSDYGDATVNVTGDVILTKTGTASGGNAIFVSSQHDTTVTVGGDIITNGDGISGIMVNSSGNNNDININITGALTASANGVRIQENGSNATVTVTAKNISAGENAITASSGYGGVSTITATDTISGNIYLAPHDGSEIIVSAGNVTGNISFNTTTGNVASFTGTNSASVTVGTQNDTNSGIIDGNIDLSKVRNEDKDSVNITAWKIEGTLAGDACETAINYIVRIAKESQDAIKAGGEVTTGEKMTTAKLGATITVQPKSGYKVTGVSNNGTPLQQQSDGSFSFDFVKNASDSYYGGILLSAIFEKLPDPKPQASSPLVAASYKLKFDFDGGVLDGETELEMKCSAGQRIKLPEAPVKDGFVFAGWQTEVRGKTVVFEAGAKYTVSAGKSFVALWEEA